MTEHELSHWAAIYQANPRLARAGIDYGDLIDNPALLLRAPEPPDAPHRLLPAQARIAQRLERAMRIADAVRRRPAP